MKKKNVKTTESERFVNQVVKGRNVKAMTSLERILKKKIAARISSTLNS